MCGLAGVVGKIEYSEERLRKMLLASIHRGPDHSDIRNCGNVVLGHNRLSIIDLDPRSHQPMVDQSTKVTVVFNGEIYNYKSIRSQLDFPFRTDSDTEVLLAAYLKWGKDCVQKLEGMFAFLIYDPVNQIVFGARDRLGIKPLYLTSNNNVFAFASEMRSLLAADLIPKKINSSALSEYLIFQNNFKKETLIDKVEELPPGNAFIINLASDVLELSTYSFWDPRSFEVNKALGRIEVLKQTKDLLYKAVEKRLVADVPFGAFLSGGMDSSAMVGIMSELSSDSIHTFNVNFSEKGFSEAAYADKIAKKWKTEHTQLDLKPSDFLELIPEGLCAYDYPGADGLNSWVVSKLVKSAGVTMAISGTGGDELFGGYPIFQVAHKWKKFQVLRAIASPFTNFIPNLPGMKLNSLVQHINQGEEHLAANFRQHLYQKEFKSIFNETWPVQHFPNYRNSFKKKEVYSGVSKIELTNYLKAVLLRDTDQMSMAHSLEVRVPFLDHHLVEFMLKVPDNLKHGVGNKPLLKRALGDHILPAEIVNRKKMGFVFPWNNWLRNELQGVKDTGINHLVSRGAISESSKKQLEDLFLKGDINFPVILGLMSLGYWMENNDISA